MCRIIKKIYFVCYPMNYIYQRPLEPLNNWGRDGRDRMVVGLTSTCAISAHHH